MPSSKKTLADKIAVGRLLTKKLTLTNAQIKALRATPVTLVTGQVGKILRFVSAELRLNYGGTNVFTESADNMAVKFTDGSGVQVSEDIEATGFIDQSANTVTSTQSKKDAIAVSTGAVGKALVLHNTGDGEYGGNAGADNTMTVIVSYIVDNPLP